MRLWFYTPLLIIFPMRIKTTSWFLFTLPLHSMHWSHHHFLSILWVMYQTVLDVALLFHIIFLHLAKSVLPWCQHLFLYIIFICKNVTANGSAFNCLLVFFEVFLFHEITFWYLVYVISWNKVLSHRWTWNNMIWRCFHCEITWNKK